VKAYLSIPRLLKNLRTTLRRSKTLVFSPHFLDNRNYITDKISLAYAKNLLKKLAKIKRFPPNFIPNHSSHIIVKDSEGMVISGTNTMNSMPLRDNGIFVDGVSINDFDYATLGIVQNQFIPSASSIEFVFKDDDLIIISGFWFIYVSSNCRLLLQCYRY
jgi:hypothetical protein